MALELGDRDPPSTCKGPLHPLRDGRRWKAAERSPGLCLCRGGWGLLLTVTGVLSESREPCRVLKLVKVADTTKWKFNIQNRSFVAVRTFTISKPWGLQGSLDAHSTPAGLKIAFLVPLQRYDPGHQITALALPWKSEGVTLQSFWTILQTVSNAPTELF